MQGQVILISNVWVALFLHLFFRLLIPRAPSDHLAVSMLIT